MVGESYPQIGRGWELVGRNPGNGIESVPVPRPRLVTIRPMGNGPDDTQAEEAGLPRLDGGWELQTLVFPSASAGGSSQVGLPLRPNCPVQLWVPAHPDRLFDHDAVDGAGNYHETMPYWAWLWDTVPTTVAALERRGIHGRVLEIGAGLGAVGIALAARGAARRSSPVQVTLSDYDATSIPVMAANAALNALDDVDVWRLDWRALGGAPRVRFDAIIGCEVIYDPKSHGALLDVFERFLEPGAGRAYIADPGRERAPQFVKRARARGLRVQIEDAEGQPAELAAGELRILVLSVPEPVDERP